jgi:hypothetical protein
MKTNQSENVNQESGNKEYANNYSIYKPNAKGNGGVIRFSLNAEKGAVFVEAASQSGERVFDWDNKIIMKWGLADIGNALAVLQNRQPENSNSSFEIVHRDNPDRAPYLLAISRQESSSKSVRKVMIPMSHAEAALLDTILQTAIIRILAW